MTVPATGPAEGSPDPRFVLDRRTRLHTGPDGGLLVGGSPGRVLRLSGAAARRVLAWDAGRAPAGPGELALARRLHDAGAGLLRAGPGPFTREDVTVVVPAHGRPQALARCLDALRGLRVVVVDDASPVPLAAPGATVVRLASNSGPAAARNAGLALVRTPLVAFVDSDCVVPAGWLEGLLPGLLDGVAAVAPRVVGAGGPGLLARDEVGAGPLDLGREPSPVRPGSRVGHLPAAVLLARVADLASGFDPRLRVGEDVDLVWRLAAAGHAVRYEPSVVVRHDTRPGLAAWLAQRHGYGRSAAPLDRAHPGAVAPAVLSRWSLTAVLALAAGRPGWAAGATVASGLVLRRRLPAGPGRDREAARLALEAPLWTLLGLAEAAARPWLPAVVLLAPLDGRVRVAGAAAVAVRLLRRARAAPPTVDPLRWVLLRVLDDLAYGSGVWRGALEHRRPAVVLARVT